MTIEQMRHRLAEIVARMRELVQHSTRGTFTNEMQAEYDLLNPEMADLTTRIAAAELLQGRGAELDALNAQLSAPNGQRAAGTVPGGEQRLPNNGQGGENRARAIDRRSVSERLVQHERIARAIASRDSDLLRGEIPIGDFYLRGGETFVRAGERLAEIERRALVYTGSFPTGAVEPDRVPGILQQSYPRPTVRDAFGSSPTVSNLITYVRELLGSHTNAAAFVAEPSVYDGSTGLKPQSTLVFDGDEAPVREVATWIPASENILDDIPGLQSLIENRLLDFLSQEEDDALINGDGVSPNLKGILNVSGIQVADDAYFGSNPVHDAGETNEDFNRIQAMIQLVADPGLSQASFVFLTPAAYSYMLTASNANRDYYGGGPFVSGTIPRIWGVPIIQTNKLDDDHQVVVGDGRAAEIRDRQQGTIDLGWINDQFVRDMRTIRAKERLAFPVYRPAAFVDGTLALN